MNYNVVERNANPNVDYQNASITCKICIDPDATITSLINDCKKYQQYFLKNTLPSANLGVIVQWPENYKHDSRTTQIRNIFKGYTLVWEYF